MQADCGKYFGESRPQEGLAQATLRSGAVLMAARLVNVLVQIGSTILLARILGPHEFGLATMVLAITQIAPILIDLGTTDAATSRKVITPGQVSSLFWWNMLAGTVLTVLFASASHLIARVFGQPALADIALVSSLTFILTALAVQHYALMRRAMEFQRVALIDVAANAVSSIIAIAMAIAGWGYWALVIKPLLMLALVAVGAWLCCRWIPGRPKLDDEVRQMVRFGLGVTGFTVTDHLTRSVDRLAVGYVYGPGPLGYFQNAFLLYSNLISLLAESLHNVAVSALTRLKDDAAAFKRAWASALTMLTFVSSGVFAVLAVVGDDVVILLLGEKWTPVGPLLCILALRGIAHAVERSLGWLHVVAGRTDRWMRWGFVSAACQMLALAAGIGFGAIGVAWAYAIAMYLLFVPTLVYAGRPLGIAAADVLRASGPQVAAGILSVAGGYVIEQVFLAGVGPVARILASSIVCSALYLTVVVGAFRVTEPLRLLFALVGDFAARAGNRR